MKNFVYYNPTKIFFGEGQIASLADIIPLNKKILLIYGGGSIKKNGVYDQVKAALKQHSVFEFGGIEPNPHYETCMKAVEIVKKENIDFLLSVGGGSVLDGTKFIAAASCYTSGDAWNILKNHEGVGKAIPLGCVLTLPATGSEMNPYAVVTRAGTHDKLHFVSSHVFPQFSILDPTTTFTLPTKQTANGVIDAFIHILEQYLTYPQEAKIQDRMAEGLLMTLIKEAPRVLKTPTNYDARANVMWAATWALNTFLCSGVVEDWSTHMIGHEITALFGLDHAVTLAIILPSVMKMKQDKKREKILQYGQRVWNINEGTEEDRIQKTIDKTREFFESLGVKTHLSDYNIGSESINPLLQKLKEHGMIALGEHGDIGLEQIEKILSDSL